VIFLRDVTKNSLSPPTVRDAKTNKPILLRDQNKSFISEKVGCAYMCVLGA